MPFQGQPLEGFATAANIGWCHTDRKDTKKDGITMKDCAAGHTRYDYFLSPEHREYTETFFDMFSLPMPDDHQIYRGNSQDLLFFDDLGFVVKTGPMNIVDMIHPGVLQPLYWMPFDNTDHVIAIYSGIQLTAPVYHRKDTDIFEAERLKLVAYMDKTQQLTKDAVTPHNFGYIDGRLVVLDTEDYYFGTKWQANKANKQKIYDAKVHEGMPPSIAILETMIELYSGTPEFQKWIKAYEYHQPLRHQIDLALNEPDVELCHDMLEDFYQRCRDCVSGKDPEVALYSPWTGNLEDNKAKSPIPHPA